MATVPAVGGDQLGDDGQAEPAAAAVAGAGVVEPDEPLEDPLPVRLGDAGAVVVDRPARTAPSPLGERERHPAPRRAGRRCRRGCAAPAAAPAASPSTRPADTAVVSTRSPVRRPQPSGLVEHEVVEVDRPPPAAPGCARRPGRAAAGPRPGAAAGGPRPAPSRPARRRWSGPGGPGRPRRAGGSRRPGSAARGRRRRRTGAAAPGPARAGPACGSWCRASRPISSSAGGSGTRRCRSAAEIASTSARIASTGASARPTTTQVGRRHDRQQQRQPDRQQPGDRRRSPRRRSSWTGPPAPVRPPTGVRARHRPRSVPSRRRPGRRRRPVGRRRRAPSRASRAAGPAERSGWRGDDPAVARRATWTSKSSGRRPGQRRPRPEASAASSAATSSRADAAGGLAPPGCSVSRSTATSDHGADGHGQPDHQRRRRRWSAPAPSRPSRPRRPRGRRVRGAAQPPSGTSR